MDHVRSRLDHLDIRDVVHCVGRVSPVRCLQQCRLGVRERQGEGDRAKAMALLDESLAISSELGMRPLMERVLSRRELLGA